MANNWDRPVTVPAWVLSELAANTSILGNMKADVTRDAVAEARRALGAKEAAHTRASCDFPDDPECPANDKPEVAPHE